MMTRPSTRTSALSKIVKTRGPFFFQMGKEKKFFRVLLPVGAAGIYEVTSSRARRPGAEPGTREIKKIKTIREDNKYLQDTFLPSYWNARNTVAARDVKDEYRTLEPSMVLNEIFCLKDTRQVRMNHTVSIDNEIWKVAPPDSFSIARREVEIRTYQDLSWKIFFHGKEFIVEKFAMPERKAPQRTALIFSSLDKEVPLALTPPRGRRRKIGQKN